MKGEQELKKIHTKHLTLMFVSATIPRLRKHMPSTQLKINVEPLRSINTGLEESFIQNLIQPYPDLFLASRKSNLNQETCPKPFVQWVGGKREMIDQYTRFLPKSFSNYFEPFLGGGAMFFHLRPIKPFLNDLNQELAVAYIGVRDFPNEVIELLQLLKNKHSKDLYMTIRTVDRQVDIFTELKSYEVAARLIYLNQTCFNALYRVNRQGQFNVPIGSSLNRLICDKQNIASVSKAIKNIEISSLDFEMFLEKAKQDDFVYIDPPYYPVSKYSDFNRYTKEKFYDRDHVRLKNTIDRLTNRGVKVMLSNSDCEFNRNLYSKYNLHEVYSNRTLNSNVNKRGAIPELLVLNY